MKIDIHTHHAAASANTLSIRNLTPNDVTDTDIPCSIGLHPWHVNSGWAASIEQLRQASTLSNVFIIGECGLDKLRGEADIALQQEVFLHHIEISESAAKPLIIHCVKAFDEIIATKKKIRPSQPWIIHGFRGKPQQAQQLLENGFHLSFGEHFNKDSLTLGYESNRLWLETDESVPDISQIYSLASTALNIPVSELEQRIESNAAALFGINNPILSL